MTPAVAAVALAAIVVLPWALGGGTSALWRAVGGAAAFWPLIAGAAAALVLAWRGNDRATAYVSGASSFLWAFAAGFAAGPQGPSFGVGAGITLFALTVCFARAVARRGAFKGDPTVATIVVVIAALLAIFIFYPVGKVLAAALFDAKGRIAPALAVDRLSPPTSGGWGASGAARTAAWRSIRRCSRPSSAWARR